MFNCGQYIYINRTPYCPGSFRKYSPDSICRSCASKAGRAGNGPPNDAQSGPPFWGQAVGGKRLCSSSWPIQRRSSHRVGPCRISDCLLVFHLLSLHVAVLEMWQESVPILVLQLRVLHCTPKKRNKGQSIAAPSPAPGVSSTL